MPQIPPVLTTLVVSWFFSVFQAAAEARISSEPHQITYIDFLTVTLTAVCGLLTALAIIIAVAAIWGYSGIKSELSKSVAEMAAQSIERKLSEYPDPEFMIKLAADMKAAHDRQMFLSSQLLPPSVAASSSKTTKKPAAPRKASLAKDYPGKGK